MQASTATRTLQKCPNRLIAALPLADFQELDGHLTTRPFAAHQILYKRGEVVRQVYFPKGGTCSLLSASDLGQGAEIAVIGNEGVVGANVFFGEATSAVDVVVSIGDSAVHAMSVELFNEAMAQRGAFHNLVVRYSQAVMGQMAQLIVCNTTHPLDARACRWLLMAGDRVGQEKFLLSCGLLAQRLGASPEAIVRILARLACSGAIECSRGFLKVNNRELLVRHSCDCYVAIYAMFSRLLPELSAFKPDCRA